MCLGFKKKKLSQTECEVMLLLTASGQVFLAAALGAYIIQNQASPFVVSTSRSATEVIFNVIQVHKSLKANTHKQ